VNQFAARPIGGSFFAEPNVGVWDVNAGTVPNSRYAQTADDGTLQHDANGTLNNVERYFVEEFLGETVWVLFGGRPVQSSTISDTPVAFPANGALYTQRIETNLWMLDPGDMTPPNPAAAAPTTLQLAAASVWSQTDPRRIKNASTQTLTPGQSIDVVRGLNPNT